MDNKAGSLVKNLSGELAYYSFKPSPLPPELDYSKPLLSKIIDANKIVGALDALSLRIPNINLYISMYVRKEALLSSQIEGTQCTLEDLFSEENINTNLDVSDVINYIKALDYGIERMDSLPLCNRLIKEIHKILLSNTRGEDKNPGEFRTSQNWIGGAGCSLRNARYIPPNVEDMTIAMSDLEKFINNEDSIDPLVKAALIHYQFETIHPFLDGNGRIGRLLIILFLIDRKILSKPVLYISYFLKLNRIEYYDRMSEIRRNGDYEQWIMFFLEAVEQAARDGIATIDKLVALHDKNMHLIYNKSNNLRVRNFLPYIENNPIIDIRKTASALNIAYNTASKLISTYESLGILANTGYADKSRIYSYVEYLEILKSGT